MQPLLTELSITVAAARDDAEISTALVMDEFAFDETFPHGTIAKIRDGRPVNLGLHPMAFTAMVYGNRETGQIIAVAEGGDVLLLQDGETIEDGIDDITGPLNGVTTVGGEIFICGANLQVYKRQGIESWTSIGPDQGLREDFPRNHFKAIAGFSANELYVAGRSGVIWWFDGEIWTPVQVPTNLSFLCVTCAPDGKVYFGGLGGIIAVGRRDEFEGFTPEEPKGDIWGIEQFAGQTFIAMTHALLTWDVEAGWNVVPDAMEVAETFYNLDSVGGVLWSVGSKDVLRYDGETWQDIEHVQDDV